MRMTLTGLAGGVVILMLLSGGNRPAVGYIDLLVGSLVAECKNAQAIALLRVEKVNREKKAIIYRKVRDLKGTFPEFKGETFTHILGSSPNPERHPQDAETENSQNEAILAWAEEGKTAVLFLGHGGATAICVGHGWYTTRGLPPATGPWVQRGSADSRLQRLFCGDRDELVVAVTDILAGMSRERNAVPRMVGTQELVTDRSGPIVRTWGIPFPIYDRWSTHRGNAQRTGSDGGPGPKKPNILWIQKPPDHFIVPQVLAAKRQVTISGKLFQIEATPTVAEGRLYAGGGNAGVLCLDPNEEMLPGSAPKRIWQAGSDKWHVDAPVAVVADRVLAASSYLDEEKVGERALTCLKSDDGAVLWKTPLKLNPWAGPTVGPLRAGRLQQHPSRS